MTGVEDAIARYHGIDGQSSRKACTQTSECDCTLGESCSKRVGQTTGRCIPTWLGICHAWAPVAIMLPEPKRAATVRTDDQYTEGIGSTNPTPPPATLTHLTTTGQVAQGEMKVFQLAMPAGKKVIVRTTSTTDVDLYVQFGAAPTTDSYIARGYTTSGNETLSYTATSNGTLYIGVHGYAAGSFSVRTADN